MELTGQTCKELKQLIKTDRTSAFRIYYSHFLLLTDQGSEDPAMKNDDIA